MSTLEAREPLEADVEPDKLVRLEKSLAVFEERVTRVEEKVEAHDTLIDALLSSLREVQERGESLEKEMRIMRLIGEWKRRTCLHHANGVCTAWRVNDDSIPARIIDGVRRPLVEQEPLICAVCPLYEPAKRR